MDKKNPSKRPQGGLGGPGWVLLSLRGPQEEGAVSVLEKKGRDEDGIKKWGPQGRPQWAQERSPRGVGKRPQRGPRKLGREPQKRAQGCWEGAPKEGEKRKARPNQILGAPKQAPRGPRNGPHGGCVPQRGPMKQTWY
jgi:hypothetical protein